MRFEVRTSRAELSECNCSMCSKKGFIHLMVQEEEVQWISGRDQLLEYTFNTHTAKHWFCRHCGIHAIYRPRSHPDGYSINARCLDGDDWRKLPMHSFDGKNWEQGFADRYGTPSE